MTHERDLKTAKKVEKYARFGYGQEDVAELVGISRTTMMKYYRKEFEQSAKHCIVEVAEALYKAAKKGSVPACTFILTRRGGKAWNELANLSEKESKELVRVIAEVVKKSGK